MSHPRPQSHLILFLFYFLFYYSYVHTRLGSFLPPAPTLSLTTHSTPSLSPPTPSIPSRNYFALISNTSHSQLFLAQASVLPPELMWIDFLFLSTESTLIRSPPHPWQVKFLQEPTSQDLKLIVVPLLTLGIQITRCPVVWDLLAELLSGRTSAGRTSWNGWK
jgi:hypothetical protein